MGRKEQVVDEDGKPFYTTYIQYYNNYCYAIIILSTGVWECGVCLSVYGDDENWWVHCDGCSCWFHTTCVKVKKRPGPKKRWLCPACKH